MRSHHWIGWALAVVLLLLSGGTAYNDDRPIYKWSPLWFDRYFRTATMIKRGDPGKLQLRAECVGTGRRCSYWGLRLPCCGAASCLMGHCVPPRDQHLFLPEDDY